MPSKKASRVSSKQMAPDNQQERLITTGWVVGFVDGEGCFSISFIKNPTTKSGYQTFPEFVVTQGESSLESLKMLKKFFGCGKIFVNRRYDNHKENLYRYCVRSIKDLNEKIIPFFRKYHLKTDKKSDFEKFSKILKMMYVKEHLSETGHRVIKKMVSRMNRNKRS